MPLWFFIFALMVNSRFHLIFVFDKRKVLTLFFLFLSFFLLGKSKVPQWQRVSFPVYSDLSCVRFFDRNKGVAGCNVIYKYDQGQWKEVKLAFDDPVYVMYALDSTRYFLATTNELQESHLYFKSPAGIKELWFPMANTVNTMYFVDERTGVLGGLGEVNFFKDGAWTVLPPPTRKMIHWVVLDEDTVVWAASKKTGLFKYDHDQWELLKGTERIKKIKYFSGSLYVLCDDYFGKVADDKEHIIKLKEDLSFSKVNDFFVLKGLVMLVGDTGFAAKLENGRLSRLKTNVEENLNSVWMIDDTLGWAVGQDGLVMKYTSEMLENFQKKYWKGFKKIRFNSNAKVVDDEYGVVAADFNNDGLTDIFTCGLFEANHLYINQPRGLFVDHAQQWMVTGMISNQVHEYNLGACAADFNGDGYMDLYVSVLNGKNHIYKNYRGRYFVNYSSFCNAEGRASDRSNCVIAGDVDNDGDIDLFVTNENASNRLFLNNGAGIFEEATYQTGLETREGGMGCAFGDIDSDGDLDLYVANWSMKNYLFKNLLKEKGELVFEECGEEAGVAGEPFTKSNGVVFSDVDNDGDLDLFVTNRKYTNRFYRNEGRGKFKDVTADWLGVDTLKSYGAVIYDFDGNGWRDLYLSNVGKNVLFMNYGALGFKKETSKYGAELKGYSTGSALADFDNDGKIEIYLANFVGESSTYLENFNIVGHFIKIELKCFKNNINGIGTKIYIYDHADPSKLINYHEINAGSGYASMNQIDIPLTVGDVSSVDIRVVFPDGTVKKVENAPVDVPVIIKDVTGAAVLYYKIKRVVTMVFNDPVNFLKLLKLVFLIAFLIVAMKRGRERYHWSKRFIIVFSVFLLLIFTVQSVNFENRNMLLYFILPLASIIIIVVIVNLFYEGLRVEEISRKEQEQIREKLSRDLHDDLASTISTIAIYLTLIKYHLKSSDKKILELVDKTLMLASDASAVITDMIWAIKPKPESISNLLIRINNNFSALFREKGVGFHTAFKKGSEQVIFDAKVKRNVYLIIKEALNNVLKYSHATQVELTVVQTKKGLELIIKDNGMGFDVSLMKNKGHGLGNMQARATDIGARFSIESSREKGTVIHLILK